MTDKQEKIVIDSYNWIAAAVQRQERFIAFSDLWVAYPYKRTGLSEKGLELLYSEMQEVVR